MKSNKDLHLYNEKEEHSNIQWMKRLVTFSITWTDFWTIVETSTTSNSNSYVVFETRFLILKSS